ncbi:hypothetical protein [Sporisorium scitamineum]|uniref:Uncharacterized protein n=1 Tax=Sporisorium scitamineum TaxID=49012 RepID=A0A0F7S1E3_9BASI|nr:hypothetical protein [Sporisorium scitamineum]
MLFDEAHTDDLKAWLTSELGPICDADPEVLADYVLALLKHEGPEAELQTLLTEQLEDFLAAETKPFVAKAFQVIAVKAYLPTSESHHDDAAADPSNDTHILASTTDAAADTSSASRKRRADRDDDASHDSTRSPPRQTRRLQDNTSTPGSDDSRAGRARERDSRERAANATGTDANGSQNQGGRRPKQLCRDYHNKGFCPRGASCKFEHSADVQPDNTNARNHPQQHQQPPFHMMGPGGPNGMHGPPMMFPPFGVPPQGWHPSVGPAPGMSPNNAGPGAPQSMNGDAQNLANRMGGQLPPPQEPDAVPFANHQGGPFNGGMGPGGRGAAVSGRGRGRGGGPPGTFQSSRRSNTTLVIENVPADSLDLIKVNEYFKKFGTITNISIDKPGSKALVSYSQPSEAKAAHESPDVIFGNRFVKVYFQRLDEVAGGSAAGPSPTPRPPPSAAPTPRSNFVPGKTSNVYHARPPVAGGSNPGGVAAAVGGMSEERKKLLDDQRTKQATLDAQLAEQKSLLAKFGDKDLTAEDKKQTMAQLRKLGDEIKASTEAVKAAVEALQAAPKESPSTSAGADAGNWKAEKEKREKEQLDRELDLHAQGSSPSTTEELKKKLESLKAEAASLGIDGAAPAAAGGSYGFNSRVRGRGGYMLRGRGGYAPYARGGAAGANRVFRIDNRTTKLKIDDLLPGVDAEKVKQHFAGFGELESFDAANATVVFKARTSAEQALRGGVEIPDVGASAATAAGGDEEYEEDRDSSWKR